MNWGKVIKKDISILLVLWGGLLIFTWIVNPTAYINFICFSMLLIVGATNISLENMFRNKTDFEKYEVVKIIARLYKYIGSILVAGVGLNILFEHQYDFLRLIKLILELLGLCSVCYLYHQWRIKSVKTLCKGIGLISIMSILLGISIMSIMPKVVLNIVLIINPVIGVYIYIRFRKFIKEIRDKLSDNIYYCSLCFVNIKLVSSTTEVILNIGQIGILKILTVVLLGLATRYLFEIIHYAVLECPSKNIEKQLDELEEQIYYNAQDRNAIINLSHELKTPLNVIKSAIELLRLDINPYEEPYQDMMEVQNKCDKCIKLIRYMIDINKLKGDYIKPKFEVYNMEYIIENVIEAYIVVYPDIHITLEVLEEEQYVKVDLELLQRALFYLITIMNSCFSNELIEIIVEQITEKNSIRVSFRHPDMQLLYRYMGIYEYLEEKDVQYILMMNYIKRVLTYHLIDVEKAIQDDKIIFYFEHALLEPNRVFRDIGENINDLIEQIRLDA